MFRSPKRVRMKSDLVNSVQRYQERLEAQLQISIRVCYPNEEVHLRVAELFTVVKCQPLWRGWRN
jgi:hypothetical protein